jgi:hypothetical protein
METLLVPPPLRERLGDAGSDALVTMFAEAHRIAMEQVDRTIRELEERFERRLNERLAELRFELLKWNFVFWIGQLAAMTAILSVMLRGLR